MDILVGMGLIDGPMSGGFLHQCLMWFLGLLIGGLPVAAFGWWVERAGRHTIRR
jgi:hypothetical protein